MIIVPLKLVGGVEGARNIYLDLGAFQGDTLHMFRLHGIPLRCHPGVDWEVFSFEACPLLAHSTQLHIDQLNNQVIDLPVLYKDIPGMQETVNQAYKNNTPFNKRLQLLFERFEKILVSRRSSRGSYQDLLQVHSDEIKAQLATAAIPLPFEGTKYTSYAMAVGDKDTTLTMNWSYSNYVNGGGNLLGISYQFPSHTFTVPVIRLSNWLKNSFSKKDYIYIKMDIEGMEYSLLEDLIETGCLEYINEMDIEWHGRFNVPKREKEGELRYKITEAGIILRDHY